MALPTPTVASSDILSRYVRSKDASTFKVLYFGVHNRAELIRDILGYSGAKWEELPVDWPAQKEHTPFQVLPVVYETASDGTVLEIAEAPAIERYLADKFSLNGKNEYERYKVDQIVNSVEARIQDFIAKVALAPVENRLVEINKFYREVLQKFIEIHEDLLKKNGSNGHFVGESTTLADFKVSILIGRILLLRVKGSDEPPFSAQNSPLLWKVYETVNSNSNLKAWRETERYQTLTATSKGFLKFD